MDAKAIMLAIHIVCGFVALVTMVMAYLTKKGPAMHAKVGRIYGYAMVGVGLTAIVLFFLGASAFLLLIAFALPRTGRLAFCHQSEGRSKRCGYSPDSTWHGWRHGPASYQPTRSKCA